MKIRKKTQIAGLLASVLNVKAQSNSDTYSCNYINEKLRDTGWKTATLLDGFSQNALASSGNLMYRRVGNIVYVKGSVKGFSNTGDCAQLPAGYRPPSRVDFCAGTGGKYYAKAMITSGGYINLLYDSRETYSEGNWYAFCTSYVTDEEFPSTEEVQNG